MRGDAVPAQNVEPVPARMLPPIETIVENFAVLDDGMDRYEYVIELGRSLPAFPKDLMTEDNRVHGCESQVWVETKFVDRDDCRRIVISGTSDSFITKGLIALVMSIYNDKNPEEISDIDVFDVFKQVGLGNHLTSKRSNGVRAMADRIRRDAVSASGRPGIT